MWNIDQRMAPHGHFNQTVNIWNWVLVRQIVMPETQSTGILNGNPPNFRYLFQGFRNLVRVVHVQCDLHPTLRLQTPICQTLHFEARFNGEAAEGSEAVLSRNPARLDTSSCVQHWQA